jgi:tRNA (guanine10-N2)-dimethyltransferase
MKSQSLFILGRQQLIDLAELMSLYGEDVRMVEQTAAIIDRSPNTIDFNRIGGSIKLCSVLDTLPTDDWQAIQQAVIDLLTDRVSKLSAGKITIGFSVYNFRTTSTQVMSLGLSVKKSLRHNGRSVRFVPNVSAQLNSAQVIHNHLTRDHGFEIVLCREGHRTIIAQTTNVQDIDSYSRRDYGRPKRDPRVGMLPPKLAQIMINLGVGADLSNLTLLDPFCGTGVVLQEALLMGCRVYGSDINPRMVEYTKLNLDWLRHNYNIPEFGTLPLEVQDATTAVWKNHFDTVVSELFLGPPLTKLPNKDQLESIRQRCDSEIEKFLINIAKQVPKNTRLCLALPAWQVADNQFIRLPLLDHLSQLGYNQPSFMQHFKPAGLIYARLNQKVARELLIITRK